MKLLCSIIPPQCMDLCACARMRHDHASNLNEKKTEMKMEDGECMLGVVAINKKYFRKFSVGYCVLSENRDFLMSMFLLLLLLPLSILLRERKCYECKVYL